MCRSSEDGGRRCNKHNAFGQRLTNLQAKKQYTTRRLKTPNLDKKQEQKLTQTLREQTEAVNKLKEAREALGDTLKPYTMNLSDGCEKILNTLETAGFKPYIVGGSVRDALLDLPQKDIDIEVYGGTVDEITSVLRKVGKVDEVGKSFGVLKIILEGEDYDVSLPRRDSKVGDGHKGFEVEVDPDLTMEEATARRDYTINALMYSHSLGYIIDKHNGLEDLENKTLKHVSEAFKEDPLRVLRGVQMASRFGFELHPETIEVAKALKDDYSELAVERVQLEFQKLYEKGKHPEDALRLLKATEWDTKLPGLAEANTPTLRKDVKKLQQTFDHFNVDTNKRPEFLGAVLARAIKPEQRKAFLEQTMVGDLPKNTALRLESITPPMKQGKASLRAWAHDMPRSISIRSWVYLEYAVGNKKKAMQTYAKAEKLGILDTSEKDFVNGYDMQNLFPDRKVGRWLGDALNKVREAQYSDQFRSKEAGLDWVKNNANKIGI